MGSLPSCDNIRGGQAGTAIQDLVSADVSPLLLPFSPKPHRGDIVTLALLSPRDQVTPHRTMQSPCFTQLQVKFCWRAAEQDE